MTTYTVYKDSLTKSPILYSTFNIESMYDNICLKVHCPAKQNRDEQDDIMDPYYELVELFNLKK
jgi:hypothetical protein